MPRLGSASLSARMAILVALIVAPTVLLAVYLADMRRTQELDHIRREALGFARTVAYQQGQALQQVRQQLGRLASNGEPLLGSGCSDELNDLLRLGSIYFEIALVDLSGELTCSARTQFASLRIADRGYFTQAMVTGNFTLSDVVQSRLSKKWSVIAAQPVVIDNMMRAMIVASLDFNWAQNLLTNLKLPEASIISMSDANGIVIARAPDPERFVGRQLLEAESFRKLVASSSEGYVHSAGLDGVPRIIAYAQVPDSSLFVRVGIPRKDIDAAGSMALQAGGLAVLFTLLTAGLFGWSGSRQLLLLPIRRLASAAETLGKGNWTIRTGLPHGDHLLGRLAAKMDELASYGQRLTRAFRTLSAGNRTLLRESSEPSLLNAMCRVAVEQGGYALALVNYLRHDEGKTVEPVAHFGASNGFIETMNLTWADTERGRGSVGMAIRSRKPCVIHRLAEDPRFAPWRQEAVIRSFGSIVSLPLVVEGEVIGTFTLIAQEPEGSFDDAEMSLLEEMAADLSFGIQVARAGVKRREAERRAEYALTHDNLTALPNQSLFLSRLTAALETAADRHEPVAILSILLPRLQEVYDGFGSEPGNVVLCEIANRLRMVPGVGEALARLSANEFGLILADHDAARAAKLSKAVLAVFQQPVQIGEAQIDVGAAVGASFYPGHGEDADALLRRASIAAREGAQREAHFLVYRDATERENPERLALAAELRSAIARRELVLHYQPKVNLASGELCGAEALIRWPHGSRGMLPPVKFVPLAEETGLIRSMTRFVVDAAIRQQHLWLTRQQQLPVAVNLSAKNLYDPQFLETFQSLLETWGVPAHLVDIELTESALVEDPEMAKRILSRLRQLGAKIYIDDFGTGYSSLNYLVTLPVHALKIDRSFVQQMSKSREAYSVVASIISMAHNLGLRVVAEGVETESELEMLRELGCDEGQGYLFAKPMEADRFDATCLGGDRADRNDSD
jgi:diguanylate cyclase (GGDEF)-like protein